MIYLLLIFIVLPIIEISLFIQFGDALGTVNTILLIFLTAGIGVYLVRQQGFNTLRKMQKEIQNQPPYKVWPWPWSPEPPRTPLSL